MMSCVWGSSTNSNDVAERPAYRKGLVAMPYPISLQFAENRPVLGMGNDLQNKYYLFFLEHRKQK